MRLDKRYWIIIACIVAIHIPAMVFTAYLVSDFGTTFECNPSQAWLMDNLGIIPTDILSILLLIAVLIGLPYFFKEIESIGWKTSAIYSLIFFGAGFDSLHDTLVILRSPLAEYTFMIINTVCSAMGHPLVC